MTLLGSDTHKSRSGQGVTMHTNCIEFAGMESRRPMSNETGQGHPGSWVLQQAKRGNGIRNAANEGTAMARRSCAQSRVYWRCDNRCRDALSLWRPHGRVPQPSAALLEHFASPFQTKPRTNVRARIPNPVSRLLLLDGRHSRCDVVDNSLLIFRRKDSFERPACGRSVQFCNRLCPDEGIAGMHSNYPKA